jgi:hypothetical protein
MDCCNPIWCFVLKVASDDDEHDNGLLVFTGNEILKIGLHFVGGYKKRRIWQAKKQTNLDHFGGHFGSNPNVLAKILEDVQTAEVEEAQVPPEKLNIKHFLMAIHRISKGVLRKSNGMWENNHTGCFLLKFSNAS